MQLSFPYLKDDKRYPNYLLVFILTFLVSLAGSYTRLADLNLAIFWPANVINAVLFFRLRYVYNPLAYAAAYAAMVTEDGLTSGWDGSEALTLNAANVVFIFVLGALLTRSPAISQRRESITAFFHSVLACLVAAASCAVIGALAQQSSRFAVARFDEAFLSWFSEQFYTSMLCLPILLSLPGAFITRMSVPTWKNALPLLFLLASLAVSMMIGPFAILVLPLPALTWCAIVYPVWVVQLITLCTGCLQLIMAAGHLHELANVWGRTFNQQVVILRLGISALIFSPLLMAINAATIRRLNSRLMRQASYDHLTNTLSRYGLADALNQYGNSGVYHHSPVNVMLIDVDHFKQINDNHGHTSGDEVLKRIASVINDALPAPRLVSRLGGEEFVAVGFGYTQQAFYTLADALRQRIADTLFICGQERVSITVSIGLAHAERPYPDMESAVLRLIPRADENLYIAKRQGRNRTVQ
jgi:diguanylate cyclase (GGDEF)-like protein